MQTLSYEGKTYNIGDEIVANEYGDLWAGLTGIITDVLDGDEKETENETPDIYCDFYLPDDPAQIQELVDSFSDSYCEPKTVDDICLDGIIMAPDMIELISTSN